MYLSPRPLLPLLALAALISKTACQTYSKCNPLTQGSCPADPALGKSVNIDFTGGATSAFTASGAPTYGSNGAEFTVARQGDAPTITSNWYIMFGHVEFVIKAAPGTGIVSSAVLQSDCLDEIDWEWLGGDDAQVQSNYFGKGITTSYNRGAFHGAPNNHDDFHTYTIDWTADQIVWQVDGTTVRVLTQADAASGQYPQTPMQVKVGTWAGGDSSNPQGTVQWAGGYTDYSAGPYTMYVKSISVSDYSTGSQYTYSGTAGTWQSIKSNGGRISSDGNGTPVSTGAPPAVTSRVSNSAPLAFEPADSSSIYSTRTGWPWDASATVAVATGAATSVYTSIAGLPSGWTISESGKVIPPSSGAQASPSTSFVAASSSASSLTSSLEVTTSWDDRGFPTLVTIDPASPTQPKSYDSQGLLITSTSKTLSIPVHQTTQGTPASPLTPSASVVSILVSNSKSAASLASSLPKISSSSAISKTSRSLTTSTTEREISPTRPLSSTTTGEASASSATGGPAAVPNAAARNGMGLYLLAGVGAFMVA